MTRLLTCLVASGSVVAMAGCVEAPGHAEEAAAARPVRVLEVQAPEPRSGIRYAVSIQPFEQIAMAFKASGYVSEILQRRGANGRARTLQPGDVVSVGTVLARVRDADYREHLDQAASGLQEAEAAQVKARLDLDRAKQLFAAEALTKPDLDAAQAAFDTGAARVTAGRARVRLAEISLRDTALVAPINGVVLERQIEAGSLVGVGTAGFQLGDVSSVKAVFGVPDSLVHRITSGQALGVTTEAFPNARFAGRVTAISPSADPVSRVFNIELTIANGDRRLKPGMIGTVEVPTAGSDGADAEPGTAAVSLAAVVRSADDPGGYAVFVVEGTGDQQIARNRAVTLGEVRGNAVAVTKGLAPGERVVVMGATLLTDGESVRIIPYVVEAELR